MNRLSTTTILHIPIIGIIGDGMECTFPGIRHGITRCIITDITDTPDTTTMVSGMAIITADQIRIMEIQDGELWIETNFKFGRQGPRPFVRP
jgi:hypothetical protein